MSQSIVNFLVYENNIATNPLVLDERVFDYRIGTEEQAAYITLMTKLDAMLDLSQTSANYSAMAIISHILEELNAWSKMRVNTTDGVTSELAITSLNDWTYTNSGVYTQGATLLTFNDDSTTMSAEMAAAVDRIIRTLRSAGWDPIAHPAHYSNDPYAAEAIAAIRKVKDETTQALYPILGTNGWLAQGLQAAQNALITAGTSGIVDTANTSLQQLLMIEYVNNGNQILFDKMDGLKTAIDYNQAALSYLNSLQNLMNQKSPEQFLLELGKLQGTVSSDSNPYSDFEQATFNKTLGTTANFTDEELASYIAQLQGITTSELPAVLSNLDSELAAFHTQKTSQFWTPLSATIGKNGTLESLQTSSNPVIQATATFYKTMYNTIYNDMAALDADYTVYLANQPLDNKASLTYLNALANLQADLNKIKTDTNTLLNDSSYGLNNYLNIVNSFTNPNGTDEQQFIAITNSFLPSSTQRTTITNWITTLDTYASDVGTRMTAWLTGTPYTGTLLDQLQETISSFAAINTALPSIPTISTSDLNTLPSFLTQLQAFGPTADPTTNAKLATFDSIPKNLNSCITTLQDAITTYNSCKYSLSSDLLAATNTLRSALQTYQTFVDTTLRDVNSVYNTFITIPQESWESFFPGKSTETIQYYKSLLNSLHVSFILYNYSGIDTLNTALETATTNATTALPLLTSLLASGYAPASQVTMEQVQASISTLNTALNAITTSSWTTLQTRLNSIQTAIEAFQPSQDTYVESGLSGLSPLSDTLTTSWQALQSAITAYKNVNSSLSTDCKNAVTTLDAALTTYKNSFNAYFTSLNSLVWGIQQKPISNFLSKTQQAYDACISSLKQTYYGEGVGSTPSQPAWVSTYSSPITAAQTPAANTTSLITSLLENYTLALTSTSSLEGTAAGAFVDVTSATKSFDASLQRIKDNLDSIITNIKLGTGTTGLVTALQTVRNDFNKVTSVADWVRDFTSVQQGNYQTNLNNAVVSSQALNDSKREELQQVMFIFEEFYKSAMALLTRLTQLIEKMAGSINR